MAEFVYPPRNLPGRAEDWGRAVEARDKIESTERLQLSQRLDNSLRATGGQLAVMSDQVETLSSQQELLASQQETLTAAVTDLSNRQTYTTSPSNLSQTNNTTTNPTFVTRTFTLPAPNVQRAATVGLSGTLSNSGGVSNSVRAFVQMSYDGSVRARGDYAVPQSLSTPAGWNETVNFFFFTTIPAGVSPAFSIQIARLGFTSTSTTLTLSDMTAFIQYGDPT